jgi:hypothetical protein
VTSPVRDLLDHTTTAQKIGQNVTMVKIASCKCTTIVTVEAVVSSDAREDLYFLLTLIFHICIWFVEVLIGRCVFRIQAAQITVGSLDGSILLPSIPINNTSHIYRDASLI